MAKKKTAPKKVKKKKATKASTAKKAAQKTKVAAGGKKKPVAKAKLGKANAAKATVAAQTKAPPTRTKTVAQTKAVAHKASPRRTLPSAQATVERGSQDVATVRLKPKTRVARAGTGAGDLQGISIVEDVNSESADELLEEGQAFEAGIVSGVESAGNAEESEVITHEVPEDDVPTEYDDDDRP